MVLADVIPDVRTLSRADKLRLIGLLAEDLARAEGLIEPGQSYPVWSPESAFAAAEAMMQALERDRGQA
jgi:hypothetical protein